jgi:polyhydroxyalkanoate synthesis regulator phasin
MLDELDNLTFVIDVIDGRKVCRFSDGTILPVVSGGSGDDTPPDPTGAGGGGGDPLADLDKWARSIGAAEKNQGKQAAMREVAEQLGMTPEEAKDFIEKARAKEREGMAEAERKLAEAADKEAAAARREEQALAREVDAAKRAALIEAGVPRDQAAAVARMLDVDPKAEDLDKAAATAAEELKKSLPALFATAGTGGTPPPDSKPRGDKPPAPKTGGKSLAELGKETAQSVGWIPASA